MKKMLIFIFTIIIFMVTILIMLKSKEKEIDLKVAFDKWDTGVVKDTEGTEIMNGFVNYLIKNPEVSIEDIKNFSSQIKIYEINNFRVIEYIENPEFYGISGRGSYHIVIYNGIVELIDNNGSMLVDEIINVNDSIYYIYVTDYKFSNVTGINIFSITIYDNNIKCKKIIAKDELIHGFKYIGSLYYDNSHIYFEDIRNKGKEVFIKVNGSLYILELKEDGLYYLEKH